MNIQWRKEFRLLLPGWITALLLVLAPAALNLVLGYHRERTLGLTTYGLVIGCIVLGLAGFGREISARTFSLLLSQPRAREKIWRSKMSALGLAVLTMTLALIPAGAVLKPVSEDLKAYFWFCLLAVCAAISGGLWTTLLLRQIVAAFWISLLIPFAILVSFLGLENETWRNTLTITSLLLYSVAGFAFARWLFCNAQDTAWTGGELELPKWLSRSAAQHTSTQPQGYRPLRALFFKELQFQQVSFFLAGLLLLLQIAVLLVPRFVEVNSSQHSILHALVSMFWILWMILPLLVGCSSVAEERKLGTLEPQLCLPVSRAWQFAVKVVVVVGCGVVLGAVVPVALANAGLIRDMEGAGLRWTLGCAVVTLAGLYASTLTSQLLQALAVGVAFIALIFTAVGWLLNPFIYGASQTAAGYTAWRGPLGLSIGAGVMLLFTMIYTWKPLRWVWVTVLVVLAGVFFWIPAHRLQGLAFHAADNSNNSNLFGVKVVAIGGFVMGWCIVAMTLALANRNFKHSQASRSVWWRNIAMWAGSLALTGLLTPLVYHRAWEPVMKFEPASKPAVLSGTVTPVLRQSWSDAIVALLPDGRLWADFKSIQNRWILDRGGKPAAAEATRQPQNGFIDGSNWISLGVMYKELTAVQADGSLWNITWTEAQSSDGKVIPAHFYHHWNQKNLKLRPVAPQFLRLGTDTDWTSVAAGNAYFVALKRDGTLWGWGHNDNLQLGAGPTMVTNLPIQMGRGNDWTAVYAGPHRSFAVRKDGSVWRWGRFQTKSSPKMVMADGPTALDVKVPGVRVIASDWNCDMILDTDGNIWWISALGGIIQRAPLKINEEKWVALTVSSWQSVAAIKTDGSLWYARAERFSGDYSFAPLRKLGNRTDWIAVHAFERTILALAKDGTVCRFGTEPTEQLELLEPTKRVTWWADILSGQ